MMFQSIDRNELREIFQPSRVVLAVVKDDLNCKWNFLPIAFNMYCGYNPLSFCFAIHDINYSYELLETETTFAIAIPGEELSSVVLKSGMESGKIINKFTDFNLNPILSEDRNTCYGIKECIINIFCRKEHFIKVSDHAIVVGRVEKILRNYANTSRNILSISSDIMGYEILEHSGIHRLAVKQK